MAIDAGWNRFYGCGMWGMLEHKVSIAETTVCSFRVFSGSYTFSCVGIVFSLIALNHYSIQEIDIRQRNCIHIC